MVAALKLPPRRITVAEFLSWDPEDGTGALWQLRDGKPEMMPPATDAHGSIQNRLSFLLTRHLNHVQFDRRSLRGRASHLRGR